MDSRAPLQSLGAPKQGERYEKLSYWTLRDTALFEAGSTPSTEIELFRSGDTKTGAYRTPNFPNDSQAWRIVGIHIQPLVQFAATDSTDEQRQKVDVATFLKLSRLEFRLEGTDKFRSYLEDLTSVEYVNNPDPVDVDGSIVSAREKFTNYFKLPEPFIIGAGKTMEWKLVTPGTFTLDAYNAKNTPLLPGSGLGNSEHGFAVIVDLIAEKIKEVH